MNTHTQDHEYVRIGFLADRYAVSAESLRVWERQGQIPPAVRTPGGHRRYHRGHLEALDKMFGMATLNGFEEPAPSGVAG